MLWLRQQTEMTARSAMRADGLIIAAFMVGLGLQFSLGVYIFNRPMFAALIQALPREQWAFMLITVGSVRVAVITGQVVQERRGRGLNLGWTLAASWTAFASAALWVLMARYYLFEADGGGLLLIPAAIDTSRWIMIGMIAGSIYGRKRGGPAQRS